MRAPSRSGCLSNCGRPSALPLRPGSAEGLRACIDSQVFYRVGTAAKVIENGDKAIEPPGLSKQPGTQLIMWPSNDTPNQWWWMMVAS